MTAQQHREMAQLIRANAGRPGFPGREEAQSMAANHDLVAKALARRERPN
ncbi:hypothetical protein SAMN05216337_1002343 [Bradyrhizobium brasilense]|uniref:Uncharacterized protein n=1 Tax=Bradyrhizobium brasilense TaxID=1419277 RepID=A0A1G6L7P8_9BRAD|nr:hypothetical protein [Bradyrhizobium brasilense]SDC38775.1 hypothetical protein SAMN05216337_1002343 [Bradyrhizobium brasilense]